MWEVRGFYPHRQLFCTYRNVIFVKAVGSGERETWKVMGNKTRTIEFFLSIASFT